MAYAAVFWQGGWIKIAASHQSKGIRSVRISGGMGARESKKHCPKRAMLITGGGLMENTKGNCHRAMHTQPHPEEDGNKPATCGHDG